MAYFDATHYFMGVHRTPDFPVYDAFIQEAKKMWTDGLIAGEGCRIQLGDRQNSDQVFATVWRTVQVQAAPGWKLDLDAGEDALKFRYTRAFNPATTSPQVIVDAVRALLLLSD